MLNKFECCENCKKNVTYLKDRTECVRCASGLDNGFEPIDCKDEFIQDKKE